jgi:hypothetical protein
MKAKMRERETAENKDNFSLLFVFERSRFKRERTRD